MDWRVSAVEQKPAVEQIVSRGNKLTFITLYVNYGAHEESIFHRGLRARYYQDREAMRLQERLTRRRAPCFLSLGGVGP